MVAEQEEDSLLLPGVCRDDKLHPDALIIAPVEGDKAKRERL